MNKTSKTIDVIKQTTANRLIIPYLTKKALKKFTWLALPAINPFFTFFLAKFVKFAFDETAIKIFNEVTDYQINNQNKEAEKAKIDLANGLNNGVSEDELKRLEEEFNKRMDDAISFGL